MKKFIKSLLAIGLVLICVFGIAGCRLKPDPNKGLKYIEYNGFTYCKKSNIYHLTGDQRKNNSEIMHINPYYNGNEVKYFGNTIEDPAMMSLERFSHAPSLMNVKELSLPYCMERYEGVRNYPIVEAPQKIIIVRNSDSDERFITLHKENYKDESYMRELYCSSISYEARAQSWVERSPSWQWSEGTQEYPNGEYHFYYNAEYTSNKDYFRFKICKANTAYMFNYENSPNDGYFFVYDYEYGETIENTPYEPIRNGYTFGGWYKEPECINAWNFETDTLPQTQYNDEGQELYQETKLYAKWTKDKKLKWACNW
ncbi:MAG: InlB B-repeat-containing protein [Clostridia bacterium]|nr:InlB B-repeat-containing protein [Clostridia bacterium]